MIAKELEPSTTTDKFARAGRAAEEQMAFYLRREFTSSPEIRVFNNIRLEKGSDAAQIDHLILYRHGVIVIESKSVTSEVKINPQGEWSRVWSGRATGMPSPVLQAKRQADFLAGYLQDHATSLLDKFMLVVQKNFGSLKLDVLVAISDDGIIHRANNVHVDEVCKADQITVKARAIIEKMRAANSLLETAKLNSKGGYALNDQELVRISAFLMARHRPLVQDEVAETQTPALEAVRPAQPIIAPPPVPTAHYYVCKSCSSGNVQVAFGKFGYYFKCQDCAGNTSIQATCPTCQQKLKVRKSGVKHFLDCPTCNSSRLFFTNSSV